MTCRTAGIVCALLCLGLWWAVATVAASAATVDVVQDGRFSTPLLTDGNDYFCATDGTSEACPTAAPQFGAWTVIDGSIQLVNSQYVALPTGDPDTSQGVDLDGDGPGAIAQTLATVAGQQYAVTFQLAGDPNNGPVVKSLLVDVNGTAGGSYTFDTTNTSATDMGYEGESFTFTASGATTNLAFASGDSAGSTAGAVVADVSVTGPLPPPPTDQTVPSITGSAQIGGSLTCAPGTWSGAMDIDSFQWNRDGQPIAGATGAIIRVVGDEAGSQLTCTVTASDVGGEASLTSSPVSVALPKRGLGFTVATTAETGDLVNTALSGVSCVSAVACIAVGDGDASTTSFGEPIDGRAAAEAWIGASWSAVSVAGEAPALESVSCPSSSFCMAVGATAWSGSLGYNGGAYFSFGSHSKPLVEVWNGATWSVSPIPSPKGRVGSGLTSVSCFSSSSCVAVGSTGRAALTEIWDGSKWRLQPSPRVGSSAQLESVSCSASNACTAVGYYFVNVRPFGADRPLIERWNGARWSVQHAPDGPLALTELESVSCASRATCVAVGNQNITQGYDFEVPAFVEHWNGSRWNLAEQGLPRWTELDSVSCITPARCTAVGHIVGHNKDGGLEDSSQPAAEVWNGGRWTTEKAQQAYHNATLTGVSCVTTDSCVAVGWRDPSFGSFSVTFSEVAIPSSAVG